VIETPSLPRAEKELTHFFNSSEAIGKFYWRMTCAGCILMLNDEAIELFDRVKSGDLLTISEK
jgi:lipoprotein-anchoring transpeptidase ErfK/SrfK